MHIKISFEELSGYIIKHYGAKVTFGMVSQKELRASYLQNVIVSIIEVPVDITIEDVRDSVVCIRYNGGFGVDMIIGGALTFMQARVPELKEVIITGEGHRLFVELSKLPQTKALVENVRLENIRILPDGVEIVAVLK